MPSPSCFAPFFFHCCFSCFGAQPCTSARSSGVISVISVSARRILSGFCAAELLHQLFCSILKLHLCLWCVRHIYIVSSSFNSKSSCVRLSCGWNHSSIFLLLSKNKQSCEGILTISPGLAYTIQSRLSVQQRSHIVQHRQQSIESLY